MSNNEMRNSSQGTQKFSSENFLPRFFRSIANKKFLSSTVDQLIAPGVSEQLEGYIGQKAAKSTLYNTTFVNFKTDDRNNYQLEPSLIDGEGNFYHYVDYVNKLKSYGLDMGRIGLSSRQDIYSWDPHINWDMFINFSDYYWLPDGPMPISLSGQGITGSSTIVVSIRGNELKINSSALETLSLRKGYTYTFDVTSDSATFFITVDGQTYNIKNEIFSLTVPLDTADNGECGLLETPDATIPVVINDQNTPLDVEADIIGKSSYIDALGVKLSNGMKIQFDESVFPEKYRDSEWYVDGVGESIALVDAGLLITYGNPSFADLQNKDYITISRASMDNNPWSRTNRWFHKDVITASMEYNNSTISINEANRATRPIIEFEKNLKLFNFGTISKSSVDLFDTTTTDVFSDVVGAEGYYVDGIQLRPGHRVVFTKDQDISVKDKTYLVDIVDVGGRGVITLTEGADSVPMPSQSVIVKEGSLAGNAFHYENGNWVISQRKLSVNHPPLFQLCCPVGQDLNNPTVFDSTTFLGTKLFSYKPTTGGAESGFAQEISYRNFENSGNIEFEFNLHTDTYTFQSGAETVERSVSTAFLKKYVSGTQFEFVNGWKKSTGKPVQKITKMVVLPADTDQVIIDIFDKNVELSTSDVVVLQNGRLLTPIVDYDIAYDGVNNFIDFQFVAARNDVIIVKVNPITTIRAGFYEIPHGLKNNPLNENLDFLTFGEIAEHVEDIFENIFLKYKNYDPEVGVRDLGDITAYGTKIIKNSSPWVLGAYHILNDDNNIIDAINYNKSKYSEFKKTFIDVATNFGFDGAVKNHLDIIISEINRGKTETSPFYASDMIAFSSPKRFQFKTRPDGFGEFILNFDFDPSVLSTTAVYAYVNGMQLVHNRDYTISDGRLTLVRQQPQNATVEVFFYDNTYGSFIPPTPAKLGLFPSTIPSIIVDESYQVSPPSGSGPFAVYGEIEKINDNTSSSHVGKYGWVYPVFTTSIAARGGNPDAVVSSLNILGSSKKFFFTGTTPTIDKTPPTMYNEYSLGVAFIRGHDGSKTIVFKDYRDDLLLELEKRIFNNIKIAYRREIFDISKTFSTAYRTDAIEESAKLSLLAGDFMTWVSEIGVNYAENSGFNESDEFSYNYSNSILRINNEKSPGTWRKIYKVLFDTERPNTTPWEMLGYSYKPSWWDMVYGPAPYTKNNLVLWSDVENGVIRDENGNFDRFDDGFKRPGLMAYLPVGDSGELLSPLQANCVQDFRLQDAPLPFNFGDLSPVELAWTRDSSYSFDLLKVAILSYPIETIASLYDVSRLVKNLAGQIVYKDTLGNISPNVIRFPSYNKRSDQTLTSGLVNMLMNYLVDGADVLYQGYITRLQNVDVKLASRLSGYVDKGRLSFYLDPNSLTNYENFGREVPKDDYSIILNKSAPTNVVNYSAIIIEKLTNGFAVRGFDTSNPVFETYQVIPSARDKVIEVGGISENFVDWAPNKTYVRGQIVEYRASYYRATRDHVSGIEFDVSNYSRIAAVPTVGGKTATIKNFFDKGVVTRVTYGTVFRDSQAVVDFLIGYGERLKDLGFVFDYYDSLRNRAENWEYASREFLFWTTQGWAPGTTVSISPAANKIKYSSPLAVIGDLSEDNYRFKVLKADGTLFNFDELSIYRDNNDFVLTTEKSSHGIYNITLPSIQMEHVLIFENSTSMGDIVYNKKIGIRQTRIKVDGLISSDWNGGFNIPGFVYDSAIVVDWESWKEYAAGDIVKYKQALYSAPSKVFGSEKFDETLWNKLTSSPESKLLANMDLRISKLSDMYDANIGSYDQTEQQLARKLVGHTRRVYLQNIFQNNVSEFKFYQGYITEKGSISSIEKIFKLGDETGQPMVKVYEDWALQVGRYGDVDNRERVEINISEDKLERNSSVFEFVPTASNIRDRVYRVLPNELTDYPKNYNSRPFPTSCLRKYVIDSGYVHEDDVDYKAGSIDELSLADVNLLKIGEYIWMTGFPTIQKWTVFQTTTSDIKVTSFDATPKTDISGRTKVTLTFDKWTVGALSVGEFIGVIGAQSSGLSGIYEIASVAVDRAEIFVNPDQTFRSFTQTDLVTIKLLPVRFDTVEEFNEVMNTKTLPGQRVWLDTYREAECKEWAMLKNTPVYTQVKRYVDAVTDDSDIILRDPLIDPDSTIDVFSPMILRIDTSLDENSLEFRLPIERLTRNVPYYTFIDWGDGEITKALSDGEYTHTYAKNSVYDIKIYGFIDHYGAKVNNTGNVNYLNMIDTNIKIVELVQWGDVSPIDISFAFIYATSMTGVPNVLPQTVKNMIGTLAYAYSFNDQNIADWDVSNVRNITGLFSNAITFNINLNGWQTSNFLTLDEVFEYAETFNQPLNGWDTANVVSMRNTFDNALSFNRPLDNWVTDNVTDMTATFSFAQSFNQTLSSWNLIKVETTNSMFQGASLFNNLSDPDIDLWNTSAVEDMAYMFNGASSFNQEIGAWNVENVKTMKAMFANASVFNNGAVRGVPNKPSMNNWDTSAVTDMSYMFFASVAALETSAFNQNIGNWDVNSVTTMKAMFQNAVWFNADISYKPMVDAWNTSNVVNMDAMFYYSSSFNADIGNWLVQNVLSMEFMFTSALTFNQNLTCWDVEKIVTEPTRFAFNCPIDVSNPRFKPLWGQPVTVTTNRTGASCSNPVVVEFEIIPDRTLVPEGQSVDITVKIVGN